MDNKLGYPLFQKADLNGFWALFADNLANMIIASTVLVFVFKVPEPIVFGRVLPAIGVSLLAGLGFYAWLAVRLARKEQRSDVTALPYGISTPVMFVYLFGVIGPLCAKMEPLMAWRVGIAAAFLGGVIEALGCLIGPLLKRVTPRAGMLGTLAGIALVWIATVPLAEIFQHPVIGLTSLTIIIVGLVGGWRLPGGLPAGLVAIVFGTAIGFVQGEAKLAAVGFSLQFPVPVISDLLSGFAILLREPTVLAIVVPIEVYNLIETMNNVESAEAAGDRYDVRLCQLSDGAGTMIGALLGSAFPTTVYIGHPGYKKLGSRAGYGLGVGLLFFIGAIFGLVNFLNHLIPIAAVAPILVFIGLVIAAQAFQVSPKSHSMAVAMAMVPHVSNLLVTKMRSLAQTIAEVASMGRIDLQSKAYLSAMSKKGIHWIGQTALSQGAILSGLIWGTIVALVIDGAFLKAAAFALSAFGLGLLGMIHATELSVGLHPIVWGYLITAFGLVLFHLLGPKKIKSES